MTEPELAVPEGNRQISPPGALERVMGRIAESTISFFRAMSRNRVALAGLLVTFAYFFIALLDVVIPQYLGVSNPSNPISFTTVNYANADKLPSYFNFGGSWWYWLGTTNYNLPILPLMLESLRYDLLYSVAVVLVSLVIGLLAGSLIGFHGGKADEVLMRVVDAFLSIPGIVILITFSLLATGAQQEISAGVLNSPGLVNNLSPFEVALLEPLLDGGEEAGGLRTVDQPVVVGDGQVDRLAGCWVVDESGRRHRGRRRDHAE